jgi:hypothetical protein
VTCLDVKVDLRLQVPVLIYVFRTRSLNRTNFRQIVIESNTSCFCRQVDGYEDETIVRGALLLSKTKVGSTT